MACTCGVVDRGDFALIVRCLPSPSIVARAKLRSISNETNDYESSAVICVATLALALPLLLVGCAHEVSHTESSSVSSNGTVKSNEKTVTQSMDGTR